ncbi:MAG: ribosome maturation factor RimM, partial [Xanthobacteraceae bacterium]|nr:ribosome maturation factor RimM [Xanthobacteraceae bacterium]
MAKIGAAHGLGGEVRLFAFSDDPLALSSLGPLEDEAGSRSFRILSLRPAKNHLVARLEGINDRTAAEQVTNVELYVPRERLPVLEQQTFYHADLVGLRVETKSGETLGTIEAVQNFGAGDLLEIAPKGGGESVMLPFLDRFVPVVDVAGGRIVADPPAGLLDSTPSPLEGEGRGGVSPRKTVRRRSPPSRRAARAGLPRKGGGE